MARMDTHAQNVRSLGNNLSENVRQELHELQRNRFNPYKI